MKKETNDKSIEFLKKSMAVLPKRMHSVKTKINKIIEEIESFDKPKKKTEVVSELWNNKIKQSILDSINPKKSLELINKLLESEKDGNKLQ